MILDTNALSELLDRSAALFAVLGRTPRLYLPVIVLGEMRFGLLRSRQRAEREADLAALESSQVVLDISAATARDYALLREELRTQGSPLPSNDVWIAALARQHRLPLVTRDQHFKQVPGLNVITW